MRAWWSQLLLPQKLTELAQQVGLFVVVLGRADGNYAVRAAGLAQFSILARFRSGRIPADALVLPFTSFVKGSAGGIRRGRARAGAAPWRSGRPG